MSAVINATLRKQGAVTGLIIGALLIILHAIMNLLIIRVATRFETVFAIGFILKFILPIIIAAYLTYRLRKKIGGFWNFRQAVSAIFIMLAVGFITDFLITDLLINKVIAPEAAQLNQQKTVSLYKAYIQNSDKFGAKEKVERLKEIQRGNDADHSVNAGTLLSYIAQLVILIFVFALALAAVFKKEPPVYYGERDLVDPTA